MAHRVGKTQIASAFAMFLKALGKRAPRRWNDVGAWRMDWQPEYGGIVIEEIGSESGAINHPFGPMRASPSVFVAQLYFATRALAIKRKRGKNDGSYW